MSDDLQRDCHIVFHCFFLEVLQLILSYPQVHYYTQEIKKTQIDMIGENLMPTEQILLSSLQFMTKIADFEGWFVNEEGCLLLYVCPHTFC